MSFDPFVQSDFLLRGIMKERNSTKESVREQYESRADLFIVQDPRLASKKKTGEYSYNTKKECPIPEKSYVKKTK